MSEVIYPLDASEAEKMRERLTFLAEASEVLANSLNYQVTLERVGQLVVPRLADWCFINILREGNSIQGIALTHTDSDQNFRMHHLMQQYTVRLTDVHGPGKVLRTGEKDFNFALTPEFLEPPSDDGNFLRTLTALGAKAYITVPMSVHGNLLGSLTIGLTHHRPTFTHDDVLVAEELACWAALALNNARFYEREQAARQVAVLRSERIAQLQKVTSSLSLVLQPIQIARIATQEVMSALNTVSGAALLLSEDQRALTVMYNIGYHERDLHHWQTVRLEEESLFWKTVKAGHIVWIESLEALTERYPRFYLATDSDYGRIGVVPLKLDGKINGVVVTSTVPPTLLSTEEHNFIMGMAQQFSQALERARLYEAEQHARVLAEVAQKRFAFLAEISNELSQRIDYDETLHTALKSIIPEVADWCGLYISEDGQAFSGEYLTHCADSEPAQKLCDWWEQCMPDPNLLPGLTRVLQTGKVELYTEAIPVWLDDALSPDCLQQLKDTQFTAVALIPLRFDHSIIGAMLCITLDPRRRYFHEIDMPFLDEVGHRIALAIDKARIHRDAEAQKERLEVILKSIGDSVIATDQHGTINFINRAAQQMLHVAADEAQGQKLDELLHIEDDKTGALLEGLYLRSVEENQGFSFTNHVHLITDEAKTPIDYSGAPLLDNQDKLIGSVFVFRDVSERKRMEAAEKEQTILEERQRLARDLHDAVTQTLFASSTIAEALPRLANRDFEAIHPHLERLRRLNRGALAEMRTLLLELRMADLMAMQLDELLKQLSQTVMGHTHIQVTHAIEKVPWLPQHVQITLYRMAQEALNNIMRHAHAKNVTMALSAEKWAVTLRIQDDGNGFDPDNLPDKHTGLKTMQTRAQEIGATLDIRSEMGQGTEIVIRWQK